MVEGNLVEQYWNHYDSPSITKLLQHRELGLSPFPTKRFPKQQQYTQDWELWKFKRKLDLFHEECPGTLERASIQIDLGKGVLCQVYQPDMGYDPEELNSEDYEYLVQHDEEIMNQEDLAGPSEHYSPISSTSSRRSSFERSYRYNSEDPQLELSPSSPNDSDAASGITPAPASAWDPQPSEGTH